MYNVTLINLTPDARTVIASGYQEMRGLGDPELRALLQNFCEIDPVENAAGATEIRVKVRQESYSIRTEQKKLVLYDVHRRDLPGQLFTLEQVMPELDGTANTARIQAILQSRGEPGVEETPLVPMAPPPDVASKPRVIALSVASAMLLAANLYLLVPALTSEDPEGFIRVPSAERAGLEAKLTGVYLTGNEPGQHGIVVTGPGEMKLFELAAVEAPRMVYVSYSLGRVGPKLCLATNQPGGIIEVGDNGDLVYGGEIYQRVP
jgi:hypothetical protein